MLLNAFSGKYLNMKRPNTVLKFVHSGLNYALDTVLPPRCIGSGAIVDAQGMIAPDLWTQLGFISNPQCNICGLPFEFNDISDVGLVCGACIENPPRFDIGRSALVYNDASRRLLLRFKYGDTQHAAVPFAKWIHMAGQEHIERADMIIPVPLHWQRLWRRRFNQSALLATALTRISHIPTHLDILKRIRFTGPQKGLSKKNRQKNVRMAFQIDTKFKDSLKGKNVILIDDVMTSGSTLNECSKVLKSRGVKHITALTIARVMPHHSAPLDTLDFNELDEGY